MPQGAHANLPAPDSSSVVKNATDSNVSLHPISQPIVPVANLINDSPAIAEDVDLIEKEWVEKAKGIIARTKNDPSIQNNDMTLFKADYLKMRYNKDLKINEK